MQLLELVNDQYEQLGTTKLHLTYNRLPSIEKKVSVLACSDVRKSHA